MDYKFIIDNCLDDREFRNLVNSILINNGFISLGFDDARLADEDKINNNDILVMKDDIKYTVQTFLNKDINMKQITETLDDINKEKVIAGIIVTNKEVSPQTKEKAQQYNIDIWDRTKLLSLLENKGDVNESF